MRIEVLTDADSVARQVAAIIAADAREAVIARGVEVGEVKYPFWSPGGEFRVDDPDGWTWQVT